MFGVALVIFLIGSLILAADLVMKLSDQLHELDKTESASDAIGKIVKNAALGIAGRFLIFIGIIITLAKLISMHY